MGRELRLWHVPDQGLKWLFSASKVAVD